MSGATRSRAGRAITVAGLGAALAGMAMTSGCASYADERAPMDDWEGGLMPTPAPAPEPSSTTMGLNEEYDASAEVQPEEGRAARGAELEADLGGDDMLLAQAGPAPGDAGGVPGGGAPQRREGARPQGPQQPQQGGQGMPRAAEAGQASDPVGPLLIYTADLHLAVFEVRPTQKEIVQLALDLGGFLAFQDDGNVTIRVPSRRFHEALAKCEAAGDLLHRNVQAQDVSEQFRDLQVRLKNSEAVRDRLERMLAEAQNVEEALRVHAELSRVTEQIEQFKGKLRFLGDRVAYSTIAVHFTPRPTPHVPTQPEVYRLPFPWLDRLGLPALMTFH